MTDIIEDAIEESELEQEREASGTVDGRQVTLRKKSYTTRTQEKQWKVAVYLDGNDYSEEQATSLTAEEAEARFQSLVKKHGLGEEEDDNSNIGRIISFQDCDECGGDLKQVSDVVQGAGSFADSFKAECVDCGHEQHVASW